MSCIQETKTYRLDLHLPASVEDKQESRSLDFAWRGSTLRHEVEELNCVICDIFHKLNVLFNKLTKLHNKTFEFPTDIL